MIINNEKEITRDKPIDKLGILDLELDINNKEKVDVEVQLLKNDEIKDCIVEIENTIKPNRLLIEKIR